MSGRQWFARSVNFTADPKVASLAATFGAHGPLLIEEVLALAKLAHAGGMVQAPYVELARRSFVRTPRRAHEILTAAHDLELVSIEQDAGARGEFVLIVPNWSVWHPKDPTNAERQKRFRDRHADRYEAVTSSRPQKTKNRTSPSGSGAMDRGRAAEKGRAEIQTSTGQDQVTSSGVPR